MATFTLTSLIKSLEYEMELGQSNDQLEDDHEDEPPAKKMRYGDAELDEGRDLQTVRP